jgi:hypothetical protein
MYICTLHILVELLIETIWFWVGSETGERTSVFFLFTRVLYETMIKVPRALFIVHWNNFYGNSRSSSRIIFHYLFSIPLHSSKSGLSVLFPPGTGITSVLIRRVGMLDIFSLSSCKKSSLPNPARTRVPCRKTHKPENVLWGWVNFYIILSWQSCGSKLKRVLGNWDRVLILVRTMNFRSSDI